MIAHMSASGVGLVDLAADSMEAEATAHAQSAETEEANASSANIILRSEAQGQAATGVNIIILKFSRSPAPFRAALLDSEGDALFECRAALANAHLDVVLPSAAKVFVRPEHYTHLLEALEHNNMPLYSSHVLVAEEFEAAVMTALMSLPSSCQVRNRERSHLPVDWDTLEVHLNLKVVRTFITISVPTSLYSAGSRAMRSA
jgi:hypothetical protein